MASLQGLPPLPKSLRGLLHAGSAQWRETERIHNMRAMIEQDLPSGNSPVHHGYDMNGPTSPIPVYNNGHMGSPIPQPRKNYSQSYKMTAGPRGMPVYQALPMTRRGNTGATPMGNPLSLDGALAQLRGEMVNLRQVDMSLLCQLWTLNEGIQEHKHIIHERCSDTTSECSSYGIDNVLEALDEYEAELEKLGCSEGDEATYMEPKACADQGCNNVSHLRPDQDAVYYNWTRQDPTYENMPRTYESHL